MKIYMRWCAAFALVAGLGGCAGGAGVQEGSSSGVTVFGEVDVGVGRVR